MNLFTVRDNVMKLDNECAETYHRSPDSKVTISMQMGASRLANNVSFLTTWVTQLDKDNWKKLA
jgi:hypothetical protein